MDLTHLVFDVEVCEALWSLENDKAPGQDGFPPLFFCGYWPIVGGEVLKVVQVVFHSNSIPRELKKTLITLILKRFDAFASGHFGPINLCTTLYKLCARILVGRL